MPTHLQSNFQLRHNKKFQKKCHTVKKKFIRVSRGLNKKHSGVVNFTNILRAAI
jgi:hypothetical protein